MISDLSRLRSLDSNSTAFEAERCRLIKECINRIPIERRSNVLAFQMELDKYREIHGSVRFMEHIAEQLQENIQNLEDLLQFLKNKRINLSE